MVLSFLPDIVDWIEVYIETRMGVNPQELLGCLWLFALSALALKQVLRVGW